MLREAPPAMQGTPHVIVVGNEKGGSGKTTIAMHVAVALLKDGQRVGTIDLDSNQQSLTRYIENRRIWANHRRIDLEIPVHRHISRAEGVKLEDNEAEELAAFEAVAASFDQSVDFLVIDTPASDTYLMRLAHLVADTLLTPLNDSFLDFGTLAPIDPVTHEVTGTGHYAAMVCEARRRRRLFDQSHTDWLVIRNRYSFGRLVDHSLSRLALRLGFRPLDGCAERIVYRQFFPSGLTAFDSLDERNEGDRPGRLHVAAQQEVRDLYALLKLPTSDRSRRRAALRAEWFACANAPLDTHDMLAD
jgi:chromosome partitioning protein